MNALIDTFINAIACMSTKSRGLYKRAELATTTTEADAVQHEIKEHINRYGRISLWGAKRWGEDRIRPVAMRHYEMRVQAYQ